MLPLLLFGGAIAASSDGLFIPIKATPSYLHGPPIFYSTFVLAKNGQRVNLVMDTGSSDTWAIPDDFDCTDRDHLERNATRRQEECNMGPPIEEGSFATRPVRQKHIKMSYADGEFLMGSVANASIDLDPIKVGGSKFVINQRFGLPDKVAFNGDSVTSGLAGLSFSALTSQYKGENESSSKDYEFYSPIVQTVLDQGNFTRRRISVVLGNDKLPGSLTFNGFPPQFNSDKARWAKKRLLRERDDDGVYMHRQYLFTVDKFEFAHSESLMDTLPTKVDGTRFIAIADTGTNGILVPESVATAYNSLWTPACNATAPPFSVVIDGVHLPVPSSELLLHGGFDDSGRPACHSAVMSIDSHTLILGHSFMVGAVTLVDFDDMTISFAERRAEMHKAR